MTITQYFHAGISSYTFGKWNITPHSFTKAFNVTVLLQYLKADKTNRKENNGADSQSDSQSSVSDSPSAAPPPFHRSQEFPRRPLEPFHLHSFPKVQKHHIYFYLNIGPSIKKARMISLWKWREAWRRCCILLSNLREWFTVKCQMLQRERLRKTTDSLATEKLFWWKLGNLYKYAFCCNKHAIKIHHTIPNRTDRNTQHYISFI